MPKHDVFIAFDGRGFFLDVQTDLIGRLNTRVAVPIFPQHFPLKPALRLNPVCRLADAECVMATQYLLAVPVALLNAPVSSPASKASESTDALDMLLKGC